MQGLNALKYFSTVVALVLRSLYDITRQNGSPSTLWRIMAATTSGITTIYNTYWDIVVDWGLLQKNSKNRWLRDKLLISNKAVYVVAIVSSIFVFLLVASRGNSSTYRDLFFDSTAGAERSSEACMDAAYSRFQSSISPQKCHDCYCCLLGDTSSGYLELL